MQSGDGFFIDIVELIENNACHAHPDTPSSLDWPSENNEMIEIVSGLERDSHAWKLLQRK